MKRNNRKKFRVLALSVSLAACGCAETVEGGLKSDVTIIGIGLITGLVVATAAPSLIESKVYSEIDSLIDNLKSKISFDGIFDGILDGILDGLGQDFKRQIKEKAKKDGWFRTIMVLLRIKAGAEKINNSDLNGTEKISKIVNIIKQEGFKFNFNFSFNSIFNLFG